MDTPMYALHLAIITLSLLLTAATVQAQSQVQRSAPLARGLVSWWYAPPGLSGSGTWYDLVRRNHGALLNGVAWGRPHRSGAGATLRFDGNDDVVRIPFDTSIAPPAITIVTWVTRTATGGSYQALWFSDGGGLRILHVRSDGKLYLFYSANVANPSYDGTGALSVPVGVRTQVTFTHSNAQGSATYIDCATDYTQAPGGGTAAISGGVLSLGGDSGGGERLSGNLDDMMLFDRALSQAEVCALRREALQGYPTLLSLTSPASLSAPAVNTQRFFPAFFDKP